MLTYSVIVLRVQGFLFKIFIFHMDHYIFVKVLHVSKAVTYCWGIEMSSVHSHVHTDFFLQDRYFNDVWGCPTHRRKVNMSATTVFLRFAGLIGLDTVLTFGKDNWLFNNSCQAMIDHNGITSKMHCLQLFFLQLLSFNLVVH